MPLYFPTTFAIAIVLNLELQQLLTLRQRKAVAANQDEYLMMQYRQ